MHAAHHGVVPGYWCIRSLNGLTGQVTREGAAVGVVREAALAEELATGRECLGQH